MPPQAAHSVSELMQEISSAGRVSTVDLVLFCAPDVFDHQGGAAFATWV